MRPLQWLIDFIRDLNVTRRKGAQYRYWTSTGNERGSLRSRERKLKKLIRRLK